MSELCPFCGKSGKLTSYTFGDSSRESYRIICAEGHTLDCWDDTPEAAWETWNRRRVDRGVVEAGKLAKAAAATAIAEWAAKDHYGIPQRSLAEVVMTAIDDALAALRAAEGGQE